MKKGELTNSAKGKNMPFVGQKTKGLSRGNHTPKQGFIPEEGNRKVRQKAKLNEKTN